MGSLVDLLIYQFNNLHIIIQLNPGLAYPLKFSLVVTDQTYLTQLRNLLKSMIDAWSQWYSVYSYIRTYILYWHWEKMAIPRLLIFFMLVNDGKEVRSISSTMFMNVQERPTVMHMQWMHIRTLCDTIWYTYPFFFLQDKNAQYSQDNLPYWLKTTIKYNEDHAARLGQKVRQDYCSRGSFNFFFYIWIYCVFFAKFLPHFMFAAVCCEVRGSKPSKAKGLATESNCRKLWKEPSR